MPGAKPLARASFSICASRRASALATVAAERRDPVVPPPLVVEFRRRTRADLDDEPLLEHALDRSGTACRRSSFSAPPVRAVTSCMMA